MELLISDKSVFEINNRYPQKHKLHEGAEILIFDDFLAKPDEYRDLLDRMPAFNSNFFYKTASPGWRQIIPYEFYFHIEALMSNFTQYEVWVEQAFTNIYRSRMPCKSKCWLPHYDNKEYAFNLWLCDGPGGTGFYNWNGVCNVNHFIEDVRQKVFQHHEQGEYLYEEFTGDEDWQLYHVSPVQYNRAIFYSGNNFHSAYIPDNSYMEDWRYSLVLMGG